MRPPIIDISPFLSDLALKRGNKPSSQSLTVIQDISKACEEWGFFYIVNHGISEELVKSVVQEAKQFFHLPKEAKKTVERFEGNFQGYSDSELTKQRQDWKEIFDFSSDFEECNDSHLSGIHGRNQWPGTQLLPKFRPALLSYFQEVRSLALILMKALFLGLQIEDVDGLIERSFSCSEDTSFARLNFYPEHKGRADGDELLGVGPHSDAGVLTVLYQEEGVSSLQVKQGGRFHNVPPIPGSFICNVGDMTTIWSNGRYKAPIHRVLTNSEKSRFSIPFFLNPKYSCVVEPVTRKGISESLYRPLLWAEFRRGRVLGDYADLGEELQISNYYVGSGIGNVNASS